MEKKIDENQPWFSFPRHKERSLNPLGFPKYTDVAGYLGVHDCQLQQVETREINAEEVDELEAEFKKAVYVGRCVSVDGGEYGSRIGCPWHF